jgi:hypothetical protein
MRHRSTVRRLASAGLGFLAIASFALAADDAKRVIDAKGMTFEVPSSWKSMPPATSMRRAQLSVAPLEGDDYPAELVLTAFNGGAGSVKDNIARWQGLFKDKDGKSPKVESKKVQGKNVEIVRAETAGHYTPSAVSRGESEHDNARFFGAIIAGKDVTYYIRMVGPDKTMQKIRSEFDAVLASVKLEGQ